MLIEDEGFKVQASSAIRYGTRFGCRKGQNLKKGLSFGPTTEVLRTI
jgi:hypothetical protein